MAYDEAFAERVRAALKGRRGIVERRMFGGIAFLVRGRMACGVLKTELVLKLGEEETARALKKPHTCPMDFTGKIIKSMIYVKPGGTKTSRSLKAWVDRAVDHARTDPSPRQRRKR